MTEEKTKIVPRPGGKTGAGSITFQCENGHRIVVPAKLAGKRGACSKCGIAVVIPLATPAAEPPAEPVVVVPTAPHEVVAAPVPPAIATGSPPAPAIDAFANLANLFETAPPVPATAADEIVVDVTAGETEPGSGVGEVVAGSAPEEFASPDDSADVQHPTAQLVARLWLERGHGGIVELHLAGGGVILPEWYEARWSRGSHGLFASQAADGTVTLTAVAWESIQKIVVRQVEGLPDGMFE